MTIYAIGDIHGCSKSLNNIFDSEKNVNLSDNFEQDFKRKTKKRPAERRFENVKEKQINCWKCDV